MQKSFSEKKVELHLGDCLEKMKDIPDGSVDLVLADLPYGTTACKWDNIIPFEPLWEQLHRVCKPNAAMCMFGSEPFSSHLRLSNLKMFKYDWIWNKKKASGHLNAKKQPMKLHENVSVFFKSKARYYPQGIIVGKFNNVRPAHGKKTDTTYGSQRNDFHYSISAGYPKTIIEFSKPNEKYRMQPTQKPVALLEYLIKTYTLEGETVLDPTMGSGSTGVACVNLNRKFIGIEKESNYFDIAKERILK